jgi:hypothetical protein
MTGNSNTPKSLVSRIPLENRTLFWLFYEMNVNIEYLSESLKISEGLPNI